MIQVHQIALAAGIFTATLAASYGSSSAYEATEVAFSRPFTTFESRTLFTPVRDNLLFLGCVNSRHRCTDRAHHRGYHHHTIVHDHHRCHHGASYACYAW